MKFFTILSFAILITLITNAQFSAKLDSTVFFKSIKFGQNISKDLFQNCPGIKNYAGAYQMMYDSLDNTCKKKYADLFNFYGTAFPSAEIIANEKGQAYLIRLWQPLEPTDSIDVANIKYPPPMSALYDSLVSHLGKPNQVMNENPPEDANYNGLRQIIMWEGYHTSFWLYINFGPNIGWHDMRVDITSGNFKDMPKEEKLLQ